jgi:hypothetical protein
LAVCFNAGVASAQALAGKFTLPFETHWGPNTLPAGNYSFELDETSGPSSVVHVFHEDKSVAFVISQSYKTNPSGRISLTVLRNSSGNTVRDLNLPQIGMVFHYAPKPGHASAAEEREIAQIPIMRADR